MAPCVRWQGRCTCGGPHPPLFPRAQSSRLLGAHGPAPEESMEGSAVGRVPAVPRLCGAGVGGPEPPAPGQVSAGPLASRAFPADQQGGQRVAPPVPPARLPAAPRGPGCLPADGGAWSPPTGRPAHSRPVQQGPPQGARCQGSETQAEGPVAPCTSRRGWCAGGPGGGHATPAACCVLGKRLG